MNERIRELFNIATFEADRFVDGGYYPHIPLQYHGEPTRYSITEAGYLKFAELIVRECAKICFRESEGHNMAFGEHCGIVIKEHFGVEK
jgi:hypothetical protein